MPHALGQSGGYLKSRADGAHESAAKPTFEGFLDIWPSPDRSRVASDYPRLLRALGINMTGLRVP